MGALPEKKFSKGFTLLELLIVITIIGIIVSISSFAMIGALKDNRDTKRISNIAAIQNALEFYLAEHGDFDSIVNGVEGTDMVKYGDNYREAVYYSTSPPLLAGKNSWVDLHVHIEKYIDSIFVDPFNDYTGWSLVDGEPDYNSPELIQGYTMVRLRSKNIDQDTGCGTEIIKAGYLIETVLEDETNKRTDKNREPRLFDCVATNEHVMRLWGTVK